MSSDTIPAHTGQGWRSLVGMSAPTEQRNPRTLSLDTLEADDLVTTILAEENRSVRAAQENAPVIAELVDVGVRALAAGGTLHYVGAGTSGRLGVLDAVELLPTFNADSHLVTAHLAGGIDAMFRAVEGAEDDADAGAALVREQVGPRDVVVGLAASGRTPFVRGALEAARERGLPTGLVSANPQAPLAELADHAVLLDTGPESVTGSTRMKAATAQKMVLNALSTAIMVRLGKTYSNLMIDVRPSNEKLVARTVRILMQAADVNAERAEQALAATGRELRPALVLLLAGLDPSSADDVEAARRAVADNPTDPHRVGDAAGIRSAVASLQARPAGHAATESDSAHG